MRRGTRAHIGDIGVGRVFRRHGRVEEDGPDGPDGHEDVFVRPAAPFPQAVQAGAGPGQQADGNEDDVVIPDVHFWVLRHRSPHDVVKAQEAVDKGRAVAGVHRAVPGQDDEEKQDDAGRRKEALDILRIAAQGDEDEEERSRQDDADGALGQHGEAGHDVGGDDIPFFSFRQADIGEEHGRRREEEEHLVGNNGMADGPDG